MNDEFSARQRAITLRLAGRTVKQICLMLGRSEFWFRKWWHRYLESGAEGLYDLTRANHYVTQRIPPELERTILSIRRRLQAHTSPATRYSLIGASSILAELKGLGVRPLPCARTVERVLQRNGFSLPRVRLAPPLPRQEYPGPQARASNQLHEVDLVGPIYLKGRSQRYYIWVGKDVFDGAVCLRLASSRRMDEVFWFLGECWKDLGRPAQVQLDNARELSGWGPAAPLPVAGDPAVLAVRRRAGLHPGRGTAVQRQRGELQWLVPAPVVPATLHPAGRPASGTGAVAGGGQHPARSPAARGPDAGAAPPEVAAAKVARKLRGADGSAANRGGTRDLHPASEYGRDRHRAQPVVPGGEEASGAVPAPGDRYRARSTDGVPQRASADALALQVVERLTDT